jgi:hypothetical protein
MSKVINEIQKRAIENDILAQQTIMGIALQEVLKTIKKIGVCGDITYTVTEMSITVSFSVNRYSKELTEFLAQYEQQERDKD